MHATPLDSTVELIHPDDLITVIADDGAIVGYLIRWHAPGIGRDAAQVTRRRRVSDERLKEALEAFGDGGIGLVEKRLGVGQRQAWRLVKRARESLDVQS
jgi:hypothetical protein